MKTVLIAAVGGGEFIIQAAAVLILVAFYCIYYGKLLLQKKKGITTNQVKKQNPGIERRIGILMSVATLLVPVAQTVSIAMDRTCLPLEFRILGAILATLGDAVFLISVMTMGSSWRAGVSRTEKTKLVTHGIYSISRNPAFLAFDLGYIGILLMFFSWWLLLFTLFAVIMLHLQVVLVEEPFLPVAFGEEYRNYRNKVCRYLGRKL